MSGNNLSVKTSSISEVLKNTNDNTSIFNEYKEKKAIGIDIFKELNKRFRKGGFVLQDSSNDVGILSQCQCMQSLVSLAQDFGLEFDKTDYFEKQDKSIREIMDAVIEDVIKRICRVDENGETEYVFDASPYDTVHFNRDFSNIDTITWVITSFFLVLKYHAGIGQICKWEKTLIDIIKFGLKYINDAFISGSEGSSGLDVGWNFTKECKEPSLYFSFAVCECYLDMYNTFKAFLGHLHNEKNFEKYHVVLDDVEDDCSHEDLKNEYEEKKKEYAAKIGVPAENLIAKYDEYNELVRIFKLINDIKDEEELRIDESSTLYGAFERNCKIVAQKVWRFVGSDLADKFFYNDLKTTVTESELRMSTTSDVLFNTVYIVNIMVDAGLDEIIKLEQLSAQHDGRDEDARKKEREYDNLLESCLLAVQKAFRTYERLKNDGKDYIVDQFLIGFNESFDGHPIAVNELRKLRMRCFSLLPMLIHTNCVVSEYLVRYPQYNMKKYFEYILDNRLCKDGKTHWIWESDGFFSGSNYYFVLALHEFYEYYKTYEQAYISIGRDNKARENEIKEAYLAQLNKPEGIIGKKNLELAKKDETIKTKDAEIDEWKTKAENVERPIEDAVRAVLKEEMENELAPMVVKMLEKAVRVITLDAVDNTKDDANNTYSSIADAMKDILMASILTNYANKTRYNSAEEYLKLKSRLSQDFKRVVKEYLLDVSSLSNEKTAKSKLLTLVAKETQ